MIRARVNGGAQVTAKLNSMHSRTMDECRDELRDIGGDLWGRSITMAPYRPKQPGADEPKHLREYAFMDVTGTQDHIELEVGYDGPRDYLLVQHEGGWKDLVAWGVHYGPTRIENYTTPGTGPKFLERPWAASLPRNRARLVEAVRRGVRG